MEENIIMYLAQIHIHYKTFDGEVYLEDELSDEDFWNVYKYYNELYGEQLDNNISTDNNGAEWSTYAEDDQTEITIDVTELEFE